MILELDDDRYPLDASIQTIKDWYHTKGWNRLIEYCKPAFEFYGRCEYRTEDMTWEIATGGWSGCEDVIGALRGNTMFWMICWKMSRRGGYYEFETKT